MNYKKTLANWAASGTIASNKATVPGPPAGVTGPYMS